VADSGQTENAAALFLVRTVFIERSQVPAGASRTIARMLAPRPLRAA